MRKITLVVLSLLISGCSVRLGSFTMASTKNLGYTYQPLQQAVSGEDCVQSILFIPMGTLNPNLQDAVDRAVAQVPGGDMMTNVSAYTDFLITILYNRRCVRVTGDVVSTQRVTAPSAVSK